MNRKFIITKLLSIICLLGVLAGGVLPCMTLSGNYQEVLGSISEITSTIPEDQYEPIEEMLAQFDCTIDIKGTVEAFSSFVEPLNDGEISILDFYVVSAKASVVAEELSGVSAIDVSGLDLPEEALEQVQPMLDMVSMLVSFAGIATMISMVALIPVGLFGLLTVAVIVRIILRLFNRRGLGVLISILTILNATLMMAVPYALDMLGVEYLPMSVENTMVPIVMIVCSILSCIIWGIGRNSAKVKVVKEEVPVVEQPVATSVEAAIEEPAIEEPAIEEPVVEEVAEDVVVDVEVTEETAVAEDVEATEVVELEEKATETK